MIDFDELRKLEAKATKGQLKSIALFGSGQCDSGDDCNVNMDIRLVIGEKDAASLEECRMTHIDERLYCVLRNNAKELIRLAEIGKKAEENKKE